MSIDKQHERIIQITAAPRGWWNHYDEEVGGGKDPIACFALVENTQHHYTFVAPVVSHDGALEPETRGTPSPSEVSPWEGWVNTIPADSSVWWIAMKTAPWACPKCREATEDAPSVQRFVSAAGGAGPYGRRWPEWVAKGWRIWRSCAACGYENAAQQEYEYMDDAEIEGLGEMVGPWRPYRKSGNSPAEIGSTLPVPPGTG